MIRKFNIKCVYTNFLCTDKFIDLTIQACRIHGHRGRITTNYKNMHGVELASSPTNGYVEVKWCEKCKLCRDARLSTDDKYISGVTGKAFELYTKYGESQLKFD